MTKQEIIAELRRSACEDRSPAYDMHYIAWRSADEYWHEADIFTQGAKYRTWMLFVAAAMEGEAS